MAKDKIDDLKRKKQELEAELEVIENELDDSITRVRSDVSNKLDPMQFIRRHPWPFVGASAILGFLLAGNGSSKEKGATAQVEKKDSDKQSNGDSDRIFKPLLFNELKRMAARRLVTFASDYVDDILKSRKSEGSVTIQNGKGKVKQG